MKAAILSLAAALLAACGSLSSPDIETTLQAERDGYYAEATAIQATTGADAQRIAGTAIAAQTHVARQNAINAALLGTVRAVVPPTRQVIASFSGVATPAPINQGERWFVKTGMASAVRQSDGCMEAPEIEFTPSTARIYATFEAFNIQAGTPISISWSHEGQVMHQEQFSMDRNASHVCLWFYIEPSIVEFAPGSWAAQLFADGFALGQPMTFNIAPDPA